MPKLPAALLILCLLALACKVERAPCLEPTVVNLRIELKRRIADSSATIVDTLLPAALINPVDSDRKFTTSPINVATLTIRLSSVADSCRWYLLPDTAQPLRRDTLTFFYHRDLHFLSNACGYTYFYNIDSVHARLRTLLDRTHSIDSLQVLNPSVSNDARYNHLRLFIHRP